MLNGQLNDVAVTMGGRMDGMGAGWTIDLVAGVGTANDGHFGNGDFIIDVSYSFPVNLDAVAEYEVIDGVRLFALESRKLEGFYQDVDNRRSLSTGEDRRLFHELDRVGTGIRWITKWLDASLGVGYAFNHRFRDGYDLRDLNTYRDLGTERFVSLRVQGTL